MKKFIRLNECEWISLHGDYDDRVEFFHPNIENLGEKIAEFTKYCYEYMAKPHKKMTIYNFIDFWEQANIEDEVMKELWIGYNELWDEEEDWSIYQIKLDMIDTYKDGSIGDLLEQVDNNWKVDDFIKPYLEFLGYQFDTVGYPNWGYYVAINELDYEYIHDLWDGTNFYDIEVLNEQGEVVDSVCECYLSNNEDLIECVRCNFGIKEDEINLIKNECSEYFDFKQFHMIPASYNFIEVK